MNRLHKREIPRKVWSIRYSSLYGVSDIQELNSLFATFVYNNARVRMESSLVSRPSINRSMGGEPFEDRIGPLSAKVYDRRSDLRESGEQAEESRLAVSRD